MYIFSNYFISYTTIICENYILRFINKNFYKFFIFQSFKKIIQKRMVLKRGIRGWFSGGIQNFWGDHFRVLDKNRWFCGGKTGDFDFFAGTKKKFLKHVFFFRRDFFLTGENPLCFGKFQNTGLKQKKFCKKKSPGTSPRNF
jgi:hypothetical protein